MGTTRTALESGSASFVYVVAIEGWQTLLHNAESNAAVTTAWSGTDWSSAQGGLFVDLKLDQRINPDEPFGDMGTCTLWVVEPADADTFGTATHRRTSPAETYLSASVDRGATTIPVQSTAAFASSGLIYIGTECISYTSKDATNFLGCTRGMYSPAGVDSSSSFYSTPNRFARDHSVSLDANTVQLQPVVSSTPRTWKGRFVSVYMHRVVSGVPDTKAQAELVYAGTIGDIRDDRETGATVVEVRSLMEWVRSRVLGSNLAEAKAGDGVVLTAGMGFEMWDRSGSTIKESAGDLTVVASGATGPYQIDAGVYSLATLCAALSTWMQQMSADGDLNGSYSIASPVTSPVGLRTKIYWILPGTVGDPGYWLITMPASVASFLGFAQLDSTDAAQNANNVTAKLVTSPGSGHYYDPNTEPLRLSARLGGDIDSRMPVTLTNGTFADQYDFLPESIKPPTRYLGGISYSWGLFVIDDEKPILAAFDPGNPSELVGMRPWIGAPRRAYRADLIEISSSSPPPSIRQMIAFERSAQASLLGMAMATGTYQYNSLLDALPSPMALGIPSEWVGVDFAGEIPNGDVATCVVIERPTKFSELMQSDLGIRWGFLKWQNGTLRFGAWRSPTAVDAVLALGDTSKAEPGGVQASHTTASAQTDEMQKTVVKVQYDRSFAELGSDKYKSSIMFHDRVAADDEGGPAKVHTISLSNTFDEFNQAGAGVEALLSGYLARMPLVSRPAWVLDRSIDPTNFWRLTVGDIVTFSDPHSRDPATGARGIVDRPALITRLMFTPGGEVPTARGKATQNPMGGRMTLFFTDTNPDRTGAIYAPSADVDNTYDTGGYSAGYNSSTKTLRCYADRYSDGDEASDATHFDAGDKVIVIERDPIDPDTPQIWLDTVVSQSGDDITLTTGLTGWDTDKRYVVLFDDWDTVQASQKTHAFQADDATGLIDGTQQPFLYGSGNAETADLNSSTQIELPARRINGDGVGRCVYGDHVLMRLIDNGIDYKSTQRGSVLWHSAVSNLDVTGGNYKLVAYWPVFLGREKLSNEVFRYITCAPWAGSTDGTSTKVRIRLRRTKPTDSTLVNIDPLTDYATAEWTGITSTTPTVLTEATTLTCNVKHPLTGEAWVTVELGYKCTCSGIAYWYEGKRQTA